MTETVFINNENMATLVCPRCLKTKSVDVSEYMKSESRVKIKYTFRCERCSSGESNCPYSDTEDGVTNEVYLERRKHHRKKVNLPGTFTVVGKNKETGSMTVADLSRTALRFRPDGKRDFRENERLKLIFHLDDSRNTRIEKEVEIKEATESHVIARYVSADTGESFDRELILYLFASESKAKGQE